MDKRERQEQKNEIHNGTLAARELQENCKGTGKGTGRFSSESNRAAQNNTKLKKEKWEKAKLK